MAEPSRVCPTSNRHLDRRDQLRRSWRQLQQVRGPSFKNVDASILKNFMFPASLRLQFRAEAFNLTNTRNLDSQHS